MTRAARLSSNGTLTPNELASALRDGLAARRMSRAPVTPHNLPTPPVTDHMAKVWPVTGLLGMPTPHRPGVKGKCLRLVRGFVKKLMNPWLDRQTRFNHTMTSAIQVQQQELLDQLQVLRQRLNEVTNEYPAALQVMDQRINELCYELASARGHGLSDLLQPDPLWAHEETFLQTRMPDPPGRALVLAADHAAPHLLANIGYSVMTANPVDAGNLALKDATLRVVVAFARKDEEHSAVWAEDQSALREGLARAMVRSGRLFGSIRSDDVEQSEFEIARMCTPFRVVELVRAEGTLMWTAAL